MTEEASATTEQELREELAEIRSELRELNKIGMALMSERDPEKLLGLILTQARRLTNSDGGSLYLVEEDEDGLPHLHFLRSKTDSLPDLPEPDFTLPLNDSSVAGYAALSGEPLVIDDAYQIPDDTPYEFNKGFDEENGYRAKSMLVVPMMNHRDKVVGVLQLINRKSDPTAVIRTEEDADRWVLPYTERLVNIVFSLAGQAAVSIENRQLYLDIENLFAGFIKAAVTAIDRRDPATSGHSVRVTELTCDMAQLIHDTTEGPFKDVQFTQDEMKQLRYAGLLHDFGKVGVREEVLVKMNKLPPVLEARMNARFVLIKAMLKGDFQEAKAALLESMGAGASDEIATLRAKLDEDLEEAERYHEAVKEANVPRVLAEEAAGILKEISKKVFTDADGQEIPYLTADELHFLSIQKGSLDEGERKQIESHVVHSYDFLINIPWTEDLSRIAEIVRGHHEKLNGTGYPDGVTKEHLCLETRIMTVCDIFDALTASDRPYKKAMPVEKALQILRWEAEEGALEPDIVEFFAESGVYNKVLSTDWREF